MNSTKDLLENLIREFSLDQKERDLLLRLIQKEKDTVLLQQLLTKLPSRPSTDSFEEQLQLIQKALLTIQKELDLVKKEGMGEVFTQSTITSITATLQECFSMGNEITGAILTKPLIIGDGIDFLNIYAGILDLHSHKIINLLDPQDNQDAASKKYVDDHAGGGEANTASNQGTAGTGIYKQKAGVDLELYKLNSASNKLTVALDGTDKIDLTVNEGNITHGGLSGTHNLTTDINHNSLTNTHNLTTDISHQSITGAGTNTHGTIDSHLSATISVHNFDVSGNAPAQSHGNEKHSSTFENQANKSAASGYAALDSSTLVPVAQLGSGTPSGTKFLRDDRSWQSPPGGSQTNKFAFFMS